MMGLLIIVLMYGLNLLWMHVYLKFTNTWEPESLFDWFVFHFVGVVFTMTTCLILTIFVKHPEVPLVVVLAVVIIYFINKLTSKLSGVIVAALNKRKLNNETDGELE